MSPRSDSPAPSSAQPETASTRILGQPISLTSSVTPRSQTRRRSLRSQIMAGQGPKRHVNSTRMDEAVQEVTGGVLTIGGGIFSRGYKIQPPKYGMTEGEFKDLFNVADYSRARDSRPRTSGNTASSSRSATESIWLRLDRAMCRARAAHSSWTLAQS
jgi:hypothetical protein